MRYIELNPVRANMVNHPAEYLWSNYNNNARGIENRLIEHHPLNLALNEDLEKRQEIYRELFRDHFDSDLLHEIRETLNYELVLGRLYFCDKIEELAKRHAHLSNPGRSIVKEYEEVYLIEI